MNFVNAGTFIFLFFTATRRLLVKVSSGPHSEKIDAPKLEYMSWYRARAETESVIAKEKGKIKILL